MNTLVIAPIKAECDGFLKYCIEQGYAIEEKEIGRSQVSCIPALHLRLSQGGLGKVQFAIKTQYLLDLEDGWDLVICAGAAGGLVDTVAVGDVVVGTATAEHDFVNRFGKRRIPTYRGASQILQELRQVHMDDEEFTVHFGKIASGDEDIVDEDRRKEIHEFTDALAVAWEGIGGARACAFNHVPFVEIRGITDVANAEARTSFKANLERVMAHVATLIVTWVEQRSEFPL
jgi:adenosylhomocysteine nucleosidase